MNRSLGTRARARTREWWLAAHQQFFARYLPTIGVDFSPDISMVFQRFEVLYTE